MLSERLHTSGVILGKRVFYGQDGVGVHPAHQHRKPFVRAVDMLIQPEGIATTLAKF